MNGIISGKQADKIQKDLWVSSLLIKVSRKIAEDKNINDEAVNRLITDENSLFHKFVFELLKEMNPEETRNHVSEIFGSLGYLLIELSQDIRN